MARRLAQVLRVRNRQPAKVTFSARKTCRKSYKNLSPVYPLVIPKRFTANSLLKPLVTKKHPRYSATHTFFPHILCPTWNSRPYGGSLQQVAPTRRVTARKATQHPGHSAGSRGKDPGFHQPAGKLLEQRETPHQGDQSPEARAPRTRKNQQYRQLSRKAGFQFSHRHAHGTVFAPSVGVFSRRRTDTRYSVGQHDRRSTEHRRIEAAKALRTAHKSSRITEYTHGAHRCTLNLVTQAAALPSPAPPLPPMTASAPWRPACCASSSATAR